MSDKIEKAMAAFCDAAIGPEALRQSIERYVRARSALRAGMPIREMIREGIDDDVSDEELDRMIAEAIERDAEAQVRGGKEG